MTSIFGNIVTAHDLEHAVEDTLKEWFPTYLAEVILQAEITDLVLPSPRSYEHRVEMSNFPEDQLPQCIIVSPGMASAPMSEGDGAYRAFWKILIGIVNSAKDKESTARNSKLYAAAVRAIVLQHRSLGGFTTGMVWDGESYEDGPVEAERTLAVCTLEFTFEVERVASEFDGPIVPGGPPMPDPPPPDELPGTEWPLVETTEVKVIPEGEE
jgi:hypothetical protein